MNSRFTVARRLARIAGYAAVLAVVAWMAAVLASPGARRGYGLWITARSMELPGGGPDRASAGVWVDHMGVLCFDGPCPGLPMTIGLTLPAEAPRVDADSAWILVGPVVYGFRMERLTGHPTLTLPHWSGHTWTRLGPEGLPVGVLVRFREPGRPPRVLRFTGVRVGSTW
ncbi:MAG TPA: hypothetical protein VHG08_15760 [Longimicrobium sp.]|nr:hypothetical protein [Longimicrobium sp.]